MCEGECKDEVKKGRKKENKDEWKEGLTTYNLPGDITWTW